MKSEKLTIYKIADDIGERDEEKDVIAAMAEELHDEIERYLGNLMTFNALYPENDLPAEGPPGAQ